MTKLCISAFVVNYNTRDLLRKCLTSVFYNKGDFGVEVFVADNGSTDGSACMVKDEFPEVALVGHKTNLGFTKAVNLLLPLATGQYYFFLHPDLELLPNTINHFVHFFEHNARAGILGGNLYYPDGTANPCEIMSPGFKNDLLSFTLRLFKKLPVTKQLVTGFNPMEWSHTSTCRVNWVWNACMVARREVFEQIGDFDDRFYVWYADWDLCKRASEAGWSVYYVHPASAIHYERYSFVKEDIDRDDLLYKVDGWYSAPRQIQDRFQFLKKHNSTASVCGVKTISVIENALRLWLIISNLLLGRDVFREASFQVKACLKTMQCILRA